MFGTLHADATFFVRAAALGLLGGMALSPALWGFAERGAFPLLPLLGSATESQAVVWQGLLGGATLVALLFFPKNKIIVSVSIACFLVLCALDLNRLQAWVWFYLLVLAISLTQELSVGIRYLFAGLYFWSGFNKLTPYFAEVNYNWFCEAFYYSKNLGNIPALGYGLAFLEMLLGIGLCAKKTRKMAARGLIFLHLIIIVFLLKLDWNYVVIPWNIALASMLWVLAKPHSPDFESFKINVLYKKAWLPILLVWLCPLLYFIGLWPQALSWQLYSNTQPEASFQASPNNFSQSPEILQIWQKHAYNHDSMLLLDDWANDALGVPMFASDHTFRQMGQYLCALSSHAGDIGGLQILRVNRWDKARSRVEKVPCDAGGVMNDKLNHDEKFDKEK